MSLLGVIKKAYKVADGLLDETAEVAAKGFDEAAWLAENPRPHPDVKIKDMSEDQRSAYKAWSYQKQKAQGPKRTAISEKSHFDEEAWLRDNPPPLPGIRPKDMTPDQKRRHKTWLQNKSVASRDADEKAAKAQQMKEYREANREELAERSKRDYYDNHEKRLSDRQSVRDANREEFRERQREYSSRPENKARANELRRLRYQADPGKYIAYTAARQAAKAQRTPAWHTPRDGLLIDEIYGISGEIMNITGQPYHVDHIVPMRPRNNSVSGLHTPDNLMVVPSSENLQKSDSFTPGQKTPKGGIRKARALLKKIKEEYGIPE